MKKMMTGWIAAVCVISMAGLASAQDPSAPASAALAKFQKIMGQKTMSAQVVMTITSTKAGRSVGPMEYEMKMSKGKVRMEMDLSKMAAAVGAKGQMNMPAGMDQIVNIVRPDKKVIYQVMPGMNAYYETPIREGSAAGKADGAKVERTVQGTEKVETYSCEKVLNTITSEGTTHQVTTWEAKEFGGMPIKMETVTGDGSMSMVFKNIKTAAIDDALFDPPEGATKYGSMQELMMQGMMKMMQGRQ